MLEVGGTYNRCEWLVCGEPFADLGAAVDAASPDMCVMSPRAWDLVALACTGTPVEHGGTTLVRLEDVTSPVAPVATAALSVETVVESLISLGAAGGGEGRSTRKTALRIFHEELQAFIPGAVRRRVQFGYGDSWVRPWCVCGV